MDDVIERVRAHAENLATNGAPHQTGVGRDILKVVDLVDVTNAKLAVTGAQTITAASAAKALRDELNETKGLVNELETKLTEALKENERLAKAVADAAAENATMRAGLDAEQRSREPSGLATTTGDGIALVSRSHEEFGTSIEEVVSKMQDGGIMGPNGEVVKPAKRRKT
jgi:hypothetical protein